MSPVHGSCGCILPNVCASVPVRAAERWSHVLGSTVFSVSRVHPCDADDGCSAVGVTLSGLFSWPVSRCDFPLVIYGFSSMGFISILLIQGWRLKVALATICGIN